MTHQESLLSPTATFSLFHDVGVTLDIALEVELLDMESEENFQIVSK